MAYVSETTDGLTKWWVVGTGSVVNRLSEIMDDQSDGPYLDTADVGAWTNTTGSEWKMTLATQPDGTTAGQDVYDTAGTAWLTANHGNEGSLASGEWSWAGGTTEITVRLGDDSDPNSSDPYAYYDWSNFMTETVEDGVYLIHLSMEVGDGTTSTQVDIQRGNHVRGDQGVNLFETQANATLNIGEAHATYSRYGASIFCEPKTSTYWTLADGGTVNVYGSIITYKITSGYHAEGVSLGDSGTITMKNSIVNSHTEYSNYRNRVYFTGNCTFSLEDVYFSSLTSALYFQGTPVLMKNVWCHSSQFGFGSTANVTATDLKLTDVSQDYVWCVDVGSVEIVDIVDNDFDMASLSASDFYHNNVGDTTNEIYTVNIKVAASDGTLLDGVTVLCEDDADVEIFSEATGNTNTGKIDEQQVTARSFTGAIPTPNEDDNNPFRFTLSKAGYETLTLENITIDSKIDWHLELKGPVRHKLNTTTYFADDS